MFGYNSFDDNPYNNVKDRFTQPGYNNMMEKMEDYGQQEVRKIIPHIYDKHLADKTGIYSSDIKGMSTDFMRDHEVPKRDRTHVKKRDDVVSQTKPSVEKDDDELIAKHREYRKQLSVFLTMLDEMFSENNVIFLAVSLCIFFYSYLYFVPMLEEVEKSNITNVLLLKANRHQGYYD